MPIRQQLATSLKEKSKTSEFWVHCFLFTCLAVAFWPITMWFAGTAHEQSRIFNALMVLGLATVFLIRFAGVQISETLTLNRSARHCLITAYALLLISFLARQFVLRDANGSMDAYILLGFSLINIPAYCFAIASLAFFIFGEQIRRVTYTTTGTFCLFLILSPLLQPLDWPLRGLAGKWSGAFLGLLGQSTEMALSKGQDGIPMLILMVNDHPFHVASECNGFGVILTSLLLAVMLAFYRRLNAFDFLINTVVGILIGFIFNVLRISIIVLLAPHMMPQYHLMHETVGGLTFWACLIIVWLLLNGPVRDEP